MQHPQIEMLAYVALAMLLGGLVGLDREAARKPAGLRTHMLVSGAAALLVLLGHVMVRNYDARVASHLTSDPIRIIEAVITGVSFLGAGTIIRNQRDGGQVEGLTTAASLLLAAAIGVSVALAQFVVALGLTILILSVLRLLGYVENRFAEQPAPAAPAEEQP
jgi:putative Mg2+ transporter-C (MgtC) family protein